MGWRRWLRYAAYHWSSVVPVSISSGVRQSIQDIYGAIASPVIHNGIDTDLYRPRYEDRVRWRCSQGIDDDVKVIVSSGNLNPNKNHALLLNAFRDVAKSIPKSQLILVGDGLSRSGLEKQAAEYGLENRVRFMGERTDVAEILNASDIFALCSNSEGLGLCILEALATCKPVVATMTDGAS
jgi:glycosyltransferase involved in cell wall biosynthesis